MRSHLLRRRVLAAAAAALLAACVALSLPAYADAITVVVQRVDTSQFPNVSAYVSVTSSTGSALTGLDSKAFVVQEDGRPVDQFTVDAGAGDQDPIAAALVIDVSAGMAESLATVKDATSSFVDALGPSDQGTVVTFASRVTVIQDYTNDKSALKSAVDSLAAGGNRVLNDGIAQTARRQAGRSEHRKPIILVTNGADSTSVEASDAAIQAAAAAGSPVYTIGLGPNVGRDSLTKISSSTGGRSVFVTNPADLKPTYLTIAEQVRREYVVRYTSKLSPDGATHGMAIQVTSAGQSATGLASFPAPAPIAAPTLPPTPVPTVAPTAAPATALPTAIDPNLLIGLVLLLALVAVVIWYVTRPAARTEVATTKAPVQPAAPTIARGDQTWIVDDPAAGAGKTMLRPGRERTPPQVHLAIVHDGQPSEYVSRESPIIFGRSKEKVNVCIADPLVSGEHARIRRDGSQFFLEDLTSKNGTRLNGEPIAPGQPRVLKNNDRIYIGDAVVTFVVDLR